MQRFLLLRFRAPFSGGSTAACKLLDLLPEAVVAKRESLVDRFSYRRQGRRVDLTSKQLPVAFRAVLVGLPESSPQFVGCPQTRRPRQPVRGVTGPTIVCGVLNHASTNRVQFDVELTNQQVVFGIDDARFESSLPQGARASVGVVEVANVTAANALHHSG